jgi:uncharacterized protein YidB (DUF937 family)
MGILDDLLAGAVGAGTPERAGDGVDRPPRGGGGAQAALVALLPVVLSMLSQRGAGGGGLQRGSGLDDLLGQVLGGGRGASGGLGGLGGLLQQFERAGLGTQAQSWVGTGPNQPIGAEALGRVFGADGLDAIARRAGLSPRDTATGLAQLLPEVVDRATPQGRVPEGGQVADALQDLMRRFGA